MALEPTAAPVDPATPPPVPASATPATPAAPAAPIVPPGPSATIPDEGPPPTANTPPAGDPPADPPASTWRDEMAGGDDKLRKMLDRYASPKALAEAQLAARDRFAKGQVRQPLKEGATPEELTQWRADNNIPETFDKYDVSLPQGMVIGEADKPLVEGFLKTAHDNNLQPEAVKTALSWYYAEQGRRAEAQFAQDATGKQEVVAALTQEYGGDYKRYVTAADDYFREAGPDLGPSILQARMPDGTLVGANPLAVRFFINKALEVNPLATVTPAGGQTPMATIEAELAGLKAEMGDHNGPYWKGPMANIKQARVDEINRMMAGATARK